MKQVIIVLIIGFLGISFYKPKEQLPFKQSSYKLIGYIAGWKKIDISGIDPLSFTHINYAFANVVDGIVSEGEGRFYQDSINLAALNSLKKLNPDLKLLISIGGWTWSKGFSDAVISAEGRKKLTNSAIDYLIRHQLDGLDFDWEYPVIPGDNNPFRDEDKENFVLMLKSVRQALDSLGGLHNKHYLQTIASGGFKEYVDANNLGEAQKYLDFINIMTYDFTGVQAFETGHHTNLTAPKAEMRSTEAAVRDHLQAGVPAEKLVIGVAFYGKAWKSVNPEKNGLYQPGIGWKNFSFKNMQPFLLDPDYRKIWDRESQAAYLWNAKDSIFFTYENELSIKAKAEFVKKLNLGGMMFWEYDEDTEDRTLLKALNLYLRPL